MKTKEEIIKKAWIKVVGLKNYELIKNDICDNGTIYEYHLRRIKYKFSDDFIFIGNGDNEPDEVKLQSLQGIENNNNWTKIESESDLPEYGYYEVVIRSTGRVTRSTLNNEFNIKGQLSHYSHYQEIKQIPPPMY